MKLLIISNNPNRASFRQRIGIYLDRLAANGIDCEVARLPAAGAGRMKLFRRAAAFDAVYLHKKCLNFFDAHTLRKHSNRIIYDFDDGVMYSPHRPESNRSSHFRLFRRTARLADMIVAGNAYLAEHTSRFNTNVKILPTGVETQRYRLDARPKGDGKIRLVWIGSKSTLGYLAEIRPVLERVGAGFENVVLRIICDAFFDLQNMEVEKSQWSLENQAADLAVCDIGLAPLPDNRFTRGKCGYKILQYAASALPVIASPVGVNPEYTIENTTGFLASDIWQWVNRISKLIEDEELRKKMGRAGLAHAKKFDVSVAGEKLIALIKENNEPFCPK
ncbi:MAG: glycosyltransferase, partial [Planctomycetota bacterium]|jgi:glycosyltransferase involved in cell wall biosynthesis